MHVHQHTLSGFNHTCTTSLGMEGVRELLLPSHLHASSQALGPVRNNFAGDILPHLHTSLILINITIFSLLLCKP